jgi:hypothetical protein
VYAELPREERAVYDLMRDFQAILDAIPRATLDRDAVGFTASYRALDGSRSTDEGALNSVEAASQHPDPSVDWLAEAAECRALVTVVARKARFYWPATLAAGTVVSQDGHAVTVGGRGNTVPLCAWCAEPAPSGRHPNGRPMVSVVDGYALHANGTPDCYRMAWRAGRESATTITSAVLARLAERKKERWHAC